MINSDVTLINRLQTLTLHKNDINSVAISRNFTLATGSSDKKAGVWSWEKGQGYIGKSTLKDHKYSITCVDFSPFGTILATASVDGTVVLWDVADGEKLTSFVQPGNVAMRVCHFSASSTLLLTAGDSGAINIWDVSQRKLQCTFLHGEEAVYGANFCPTETYLVSGCRAGNLQLWDASGGTKQLAIYENAHNDCVTSISFAPAVSAAGLSKKCLMVTGGQDHFVKLWNITLGIECDIKLLRILDAHSATVFCVRMSSNGIIASASGDKTVRLWNLSGKCIKVLEGHDRYVTSCGFSPDGRLLASGSNDKSVIVWDLTGAIQVTDDMNASNEQLGLTAEEVWPQYERLYKSRMQQEKNGVSLKASFEIAKVDFNSCLMIGSSIVLAAASNSKFMYAWHLDTTSPMDISSVWQHKCGVNSISYCQQTETVASVSSDGIINLANVKASEKLGGLYHPSGSALRTVQLSPDGSLLIAGGDDEKASLWRVSSNTLIKQFCEHEAAIYGSAFSPCGQYVVTGCSNGMIKLWSCDEENATSLCTQTGAHELGVVSCDFSPTGLGGTRGQHRLLLASGGNDSQIKLWQLSIGPQSSANFSLWQTLTDHGASSVMCVSFSPSGKLLASAAGDKTVRLWDVCSGTCVQVIEGHDRYVTSVAFSSGSLLVSCSSDHTVKVWQLHGCLACETASVENLAIENMINKWSCEDVINWLAEIGLGDLGHVFESIDISGPKLIRINESMLITELGIEDEHVRKQLLTELQWLKSLGVSSKKDTNRAVTITAPQDFFCPITHDIYAEPVICSDGHTYERAAITEWFLTGKIVSPVTNAEFGSLSLTPNFELQNRISEFLAQRLVSTQQV